MKLHAPLVLALLLTAGTGAHGQVAVSFAGDYSLARVCYVAALQVVKTGAVVASDSLASCNAAIESPMNVRDRAATFDNRGILNEALQNHAAAYSDFNNSIRLNASLGDAWLNRGATLIRLNRLDDALSDIQHGIALGPTMLQVGYYDLGVAQQSLGRIPEAYDSYKRSLASDPDFAPAAAALKNFRVVPAGG
jgi:tetratricopeptide (TPR) repeat protein